MEQKREISRKKTYLQIRAITFFATIGALILTLNISEAKAAEFSIFETVAQLFGWQTANQVSETKVDLMASFTPGNLVVCRVGDGAAALTNAATPVFLDEYTTGGTLVQSIPMPTTVSGSNRILTASGTATTECMLSRSADGQYLVVSGYDATVGTAAVSSTTAAANNRVVGRIGVNGIPDTSTALNTPYSANSIRSAASSNGTDIWTAGASTPGIGYTTFGSTATTQISTTVTNLRQVNVFDGQLYASSGSGTFRMTSVGTGLPTTSGQTITNLPGFPTTGSPYGFFFADINAGVAGVDTLYVADDTTTTGGIQKYSFDGTTWTARGAVVAPGRGLAATVSGTTVTLYLTTSSSTSANTIVSLVDTTGSTGTITGTPTLVATAGTNTVFRGIAPTPVSGTGGTPTVNLSVSANSGTEAGATAITVTATASSAVSGNQTVSLGVSGTNITAGDYTLSNTTITIPGGSTTGTVTFTVVNDTVYEGTETATLTMSNPSSGITLGTTTTQNVTITDNDAAPTLAINDVSANEGNSGTTNFTFTVTKTGSTELSATVNFATADGTATAGSDYTTNSGSLTFSPAATTQTVTVVVNGDTTVEPNETFFVNLSAANNATISDNQGVGTIQNDDAAAAGTIQFSAATYNGAEGTSATITATRTGGSDGAVSVNYATSNGTATSGAACGTAGTDYVSSSGTLNWASGDSAAKTFTVQLCGDNNAEATETVNLALSNPTGGATIGTQGTAVLNIFDTASQFCNADGTITIPATGTSGPATPYPSVINVSGTTGNISSMRVTLYNITHTFPTDIDILLVSPTGQKYLLMSDAGGSQPVTNQTVTFSDSAASQLPQTSLLTGTYKPANYDTPNDVFPTPAPAAPYNNPGPGGTPTGTDTLTSTFGGNSPNGTWQLFINDDGNGDVGTISGWCLEFTTQGQPGSLQFSSATYTVGEGGGNATITVTRTGGTDGAVSATYSLTNGTATGGAACGGNVDFVNTGGTVSFASGETSKTFNVPICDDTAVEPSETVNLALSNPTGGATIGTPAAAVLTITDNDVAQPGALQFSAATYSVGEAGPTATITVTRTGGSDGTVGVSYASSNGTATGGAACGAGVDYQNTSGTLSFANGETSKTFTVPICDDNLFEGNETVNLTLSTPTGGATLGTPTSAVLTITDNDAQPSIQFDTARVSGRENVGTLPVTITRTGAVGNAVSINFATANGTATGGTSCTAGVDYVTASGTLNFAPGETSKFINVQLCNDTVFEGLEDFTIMLSSPTGGAVLGTPNPVTVVIINVGSTRADFDGDGRTDISVYRPLSANETYWYWKESSTGNLRSFEWGQPGDVPTPADFDGDGKTDFAIWRPGPATQAAFYIYNSSNNTIRIETFGQNGDNTSVVGDYDGDRKADLAVYRSGAPGTFYYRGSLNNPNGNVTFINWGTTGDKPVNGDFNGDGRADFAVYRSGVWWILFNGTFTSEARPFGLSTDTLVPADYDGDGKTDIAVFRPSDRVWYILRSSNNAVTYQQFGLSTDIPVPGDYDGDGRYDIAVYRSGTWYLLPSSASGFSTDLLGNNTDTPLPSVFVVP